MRPARTDNAWSTFVAVALFLLMAATWAFIPPTAIRNAWIAERAEVYAIAGKGESALSTVVPWTIWKNRWRRIFAASSSTLNRQGRDPSGVPTSALGRRAGSSRPGCGSAWSPTACKC
jgi:hypothetical protein